MSDLIELLRVIYKKLDNGDKETIKKVVSHIEETTSQLSDLQASIQRHPLPEAPTSGTIKVVDPATQFEWLLSFRYHTEDELIGSVPRLSAKLTNAGLIGFDAYVDQRRAERGQDTQENKAQSNNGNPPMCPTHNKPMKAGQRGGWYCPTRIADDDGTGKPVYCKQKA